MFSRWGEFAYQHRRVIPLVVVAIIILLYLTFGMRLSDRMSQEGWDDPNSDGNVGALVGDDRQGDGVVVDAKLLDPPGVCAVGVGRGCGGNHGVDGGGVDNHGPDAGDQNPENPDDGSSEGEAHIPKRHAHPHDEHQC